MELNINYPAYFKDFYGVDDEVHRFCQRAYLFFKGKEYSDVLHTMGITPVAANTPLLRSRRQTPLWRLSVCTGEVY